MGSRHFRPASLGISTSSVGSLWAFMLRLWAVFGHRASSLGIELRLWASSFVFGSGPEFVGIAALFVGIGAESLGI